MARVTVEDCVLQVPNRFQLVMLAAQRAREISAGGQLTIDRDNDKNPVVALREIADTTVNLDGLADSLVKGLQRQVEQDEPEEEGAGFGAGAGDLLAEMQQAQISKEEAEDSDLSIDGEFEDAAIADEESGNTAASGFFGVVDGADGGAVERGTERSVTSNHAATTIRSDHD